MSWMPIFEEGKIKVLGSDILTDECRIFYKNEEIFCGRINRAINEGILLGPAVTHFKQEVAATCTILDKISRDWVYRSGIQTMCGGTFWAIEIHKSDDTVIFIERVGVLFRWEASPEERLSRGFRFLEALADKFPYVAKSLANPIEII